MITFTEDELRYMGTCPDVLRAVADYHEVQQQRANSMGYGCTGDQIRQTMLEKEAARLEAEY